MVAIACLVLLLAPAVVAPRGATQDHPVLVHERQLLDAVIARDRATLDRLLADDLLATGPSGRTLDKPALLSRWTEADPTITDQRSSLLQPTVRPLGDIVIVHARIVDGFRKDGVRSEVVTQVTDVWARRRGAWRLVALHETRVAAP